MKKLKKWVLYSLLSLLFLLAVLIAAPFLFKDKIIQILKKELNEKVYQARIDWENIDLSLIGSFPDLRLNITQIHIRNQGAFNDMDVLQIGNLSIDIDLMSVIKGKTYKVNTIALDQVLAQVLVDSSGRANYDIFKKDTTQTEVPDSNAAPASFQLQLRNLSIRQAHLRYEDVQANSIYEVKDLDYTLSGDFSASITDLAMQLGIGAAYVKQSGINYVRHAQVKARIALNADLDEKKFTFRENTFQINALTLQLNGFVKLLKEGYAMDIKLGVPEVHLKNVLSLIPALYTKDFKEMIARGRTELSASVQGVYDKKKYPKFNLSLFVKDGTFKYPSLPKQVENIQIDLKVQNKKESLDSMVINLERFYVTLADNPIEARLKITRPISNPNIASFVKGRIDLSSVKDFIPMDLKMTLQGIVEADMTLAGTKELIDKKKYTEFKAQGTVSVRDIVYTSADFPKPVSVRELRLSLSPERVVLQRLAAKIGRSDVAAQGSIDNFLGYLLGKNQILKGQFQLNADTIDLKDLGGGDTTKSVSKKPADGLDTAISAPVLPKNIDFALHANIAHLFLDKWHMKNLRGKVGLRNRVATLSDLIFSLIDASFVVNGAYATSDPKQPQVTFKVAIQDLDIQKALKAFPITHRLGAEIAKECQGNIRCNMQFNTVLSDSLTPVLNTLDGSGSLTARALSIQGEQSAQLMRLLNQSGRNLQLKEIQLNFAIKKGVLSLQPFPLIMGGINGICSAEYGLDQTMKMAYKAQVPVRWVEDQLQQFSEVTTWLEKARQNGLTQILPEQVGVVLSAEGAVKKPAFKLSIDPAFAQSVKNNVEKAIQQKLKEVADKAKEELRRQGEKVKEKAQQELNKQKDKLLEKGKKELGKWLPF